MGRHGRDEDRGSVAEDQPDGPVLDDLGAVALDAGRLRRYLHGPDTAAERAEARRRLDRLTADCWTVR